MSRYFANFVRVFVIVLIGFSAAVITFVPSNAATAACSSSPLQCADTNGNGYIDDDEAYAASSGGYSKQDQLLIIEYWNTHKQVSPIQNATKEPVGTISISCNLSTVYFSQTAEPPAVTCTAQAQGTWSVTSPATIAGSASRTKTISLRVKRQEGIITVKFDDGVRFAAYDIEVKQQAASAPKQDPITEPQLQQTSWRCQSAYSTPDPYTQNAISCLSAGNQATLTQFKDSCSTATNTYLEYTLLNKTPDDLSLHKAYEIMKGVCPSGSQCDTAGTRCVKTSWTKPIVTATTTTPRKVIAPEDPRDNDNDGIYEDINTNRAFDFADCVLLYQKFNDPSFQSQKDRYDFDGDKQLTTNDAVECANQIGGDSADLKTTNPDEAKKNDPVIAGPKTTIRATQVSTQSVKAGTIINVSVAIAGDVPAPGVFMSLVRSAETKAITTRQLADDGTNGDTKARDLIYAGVLATDQLAPGIYQLIIRAGDAERRIEITILGPQQELTSCATINGSGGSNNRGLNIVFVGDSTSYSSMDAFKAAASQHYAFLTNFVPFNEFKGTINGRVATTLVPGMCVADFEGYGACNGEQAIRKAALACPMDEIIFLSRTHFTSYAASHLIFVSAPQESDRNLHKTVHEFGHSFGGLVDEYVVTASQGGTGIGKASTSNSTPNCSAPSATQACQPWCTGAPIGSTEYKQRFQQERSNSPCFAITDQTNCQSNSCIWLENSNPTYSYFQRNCVPKLSDTVSVGMSCMAGTGCYQGCYYYNWFRSVPGGIMREVVMGTFGAYNESLLRQKLNTYK